MGITRAYSQESPVPVMTEEQLQQMKEVQAKVEKLKKMPKSRKRVKKS